MKRILFYSDFHHILALLPWYILFFENIPVFDLSQVKKWRQQLGCNSRSVQWARHFLLCGLWTQSDFFLHTLHVNHVLPVGPNSELPVLPYVVSRAGV